MKNGISKIIYSVAIMLLMVTSALSFTILFRPYYYANIKILHLEEETGSTYEEIKDAYDNVMDFLLTGNDLTTDALESKDAIEHFVDVKKLFVLNFVLNFLSLAAIIILKAAEHKKKISLKNKKISPEVISVIVLPCCFLPFVIWGMIDFDSLFICFHRLFFPGKTNWYIEDKIIEYLPAKLWMNFALLIVGLLLMQIAIIIIRDIRIKKKNKTA